MSLHEGRFYQNRVTENNLILHSDNPGAIALNCLNESPNSPLKDRWSPETWGPIMQNGKSSINGKTWLMVSNRFGKNPLRLGRILFYETGER